MMGEIVLRSILAAGLAVCLAGPIGGAIGWALARRRVPLKPLVDTLVTLPLVLPPVAVGVLLLYALAPRWSPLGAALHAAGLDVFLTFRGVVVCAAVMGLPLMVRSAEAAFAAAPREADEAALNLGAGRAQTFLRVTIPLAARGLLGGLLLAFARGLSEFGATMVLAGHRPGRTDTIATSLYFTFNAPGRDADAAWLLGASVALCLATTLAARLALGDIRFPGWWRARTGLESRKSGGSRSE